MAAGSSTCHVSGSYQQKPLAWRSACLKPAVCEALDSPASATSAPAATVAPRLSASSATARTKPARPRCIWRLKSSSASAARDRPPLPPAGASRSAGDNQAPLMVHFSTQSLPQEQAHGGPSILTSAAALVQLLLGYGQQLSCRGGNAADGLDGRYAAYKAVCLKAGNILHIGRCHRGACTQRPHACITSALPQQCAACLLPGAAQRSGMQRPDGGD